MALKDFSPILRNDTSIEQEELYTKHKVLSDESKYDKTSETIQNCPDAINASMLNGWENKLYKLYKMQIDFYDPYVYKKTEPTSSEMENKTIWQQEY